MYGCGLRMSEVLNLRIKDIDMGFNKIYVWDSKSLKDRVVPLPLKLKQRLEVQIEAVSELHKKDIFNGHGTVYMPFALEKKYPKSKNETKWQFLFPMNNVSRDPRSQTIRRHHIHPKTLGRNIKVASQKANLNRSIQELLGHKSVETTMLYTHVVSEMNKSKVIKPIEFLESA